MTRIVVDLGQNGSLLGLSQTEESGVTTFVSWASLAQILQKAKVGSMRSDEFIKQIRADRHGLTVRIGEKE